MREIKYRVWNIQENKWSINTFPSWRLSEWWIMEMLPHDKFRISEFTWLLDKNGKEIYEGDIIQYKQHEWYLLPDSIWEVMWADVWYSISDRLWRNPDIDFWDHDELEVDLLDHCEIIWNIYENPNLLPNK